MAEEDLDALQASAERLAEFYSSYRVELHDGVTFTIEASIDGVPWTIQLLTFGAAQLGRHNPRVWGTYDEIWEFPTLGLALDAMHDLLGAAIAGEPAPTDWPTGWRRHRPGAVADGWDRQGEAAQDW